MNKQKRALKNSVKLWQAVLKIPKSQMHPDDIQDIRFHIHAIQNILYTQQWFKFKNKC